MESLPVLIDHLGALQVAVVPVQLIKPGVP